MDYILVALKSLNEDNEIVSVSKNPIEVSKNELTVDDELNTEIVNKIDVLSKALADAFKKEHIDVDAKLIKQDMLRDCGLMGDIISTDELDVENNPFDKATKELHDLGPVNPTEACRELLRVPAEEFVNRFMMGLRANRGMLGGPQFGRQLPNHNIRRIG